MASIDKIKIGAISYDISPSKNGTLIGFTSNDNVNPTTWAATDVISAADSHSSRFSKLTSMVKNIRWLYNKLGTTDFSATSQSTVTGALSVIKSALDGKANSNHSHTVSALPVSSQQVNDNNHILTSALVYSMQQSLNTIQNKINSLS